MVTTRCNSCGDSFSEFTVSLFPTGETGSLSFDCRKLDRCSFSFCKSPKSTWSSIWRLFLCPKGKGIPPLRVGCSDIKKVCMGIKIESNQPNDDGRLDKANLVNHYQKKANCILGSVYTMVRLWNRKEGVVEQRLSGRTRFFRFANTLKARAVTRLLEKRGTKI